MEKLMTEDVVHCDQSRGSIAQWYKNVTSEEEMLQENSQVEAEYNVEARYVLETLPGEGVTEEFMGSFHEEKEVLNMQAVDQIVDVRKPKGVLVETKGSQKVNN
jgi:hypothetical protein